MKHNYLFIARIAFVLIFEVICFVQASKTDLTIRNRTNSGRRATKAMSVSESKPIIIRIQPPESAPQGRAMPNLSSPVSQSSVLRLKPVIRFHSTPSTSESASSAENLYNEVRRMGLTMLEGLLRHANLGAELANAGALTIFAPTDEAFAMMPGGFLQSLLSSDPKVARNFVLQHIIRGHLNGEGIRNDFSMPSAHPSSPPVRFNVYSDGQIITVSGAQFLDTHQEVGDVLVQPVDRVIHPAADSDLVNKARQDFKQFHSLLQKSGLSNQLASGTFTLFAPIDDAFRSLPQKARNLFLNNSTLLRKLVLNHVVPGTYFSPALVSGFSLKPLGGDPLLFTTRRGLILVNGVPIIKPDQLSTNGVIHGLNRVLVPDELIEQCRCMKKYSLSPATLRPKSSLTKTPETLETPPEDLDSSEFGTRIKPLSTKGRLPLSPTEGTPEEGITALPPLVDFQETKKPLDQMMGDPVKLPDGRKATFDTANNLFRKSLIIARLRQPGVKGLTILLPTDRAFQRLQPEALDKMKQDPIESTRVLRWHILEGNIDPRSLRNNTPIKTAAGGNFLVKVLPARKGLLIGGVRILSASRGPDGSIFVVDRLLDPPVKSSDVSQKPNTSITPASPPTSLTTWKKLIEDVPAVKKQLKSKSKFYTMFVPINAAFTSLKPEHLKRILTDNNLKSDLVLSHVMEGPFYSTMLRTSPKLVATSLRGNKLNFELMPNSTEAFKVNGVPVHRAPIVTSNGIIYIIDNFVYLPMMPRSLDGRELEGDEDADAPSTTLEDIAMQRNATIFMKWIHASGLRHTIRTQRPCTVFLPTNEAVENMSPTLRMITISDVKILRRLVQYHICPASVRSRNALSPNDLMLPTLLPGKHIRCNTYNNNSIQTVTGCPVSNVIPSGNEKEPDVVIVNRTLTPPVGDVFLTASKSPLLRNFTKVLKVADIDLSGEGPFTIFAPAKCAFSKMPPQEYHKLITDKDAARDFVQRHVVRGSIYLAGMSDGMTLTTIGGQPLRISKPPDCIRVNGIKMKYGDLSSTNGVVHIVADFLSRMT